MALGVKGIRHSGAVRKLRGDKTPFSAAIERIFADDSIYCLWPDPELIERELQQIPSDNLTPEETREILESMLKEETTRRSKALRQRLIDASDFAEADKAEECRAVLQEVGLALDVEDLDDLPILEQMAVVHDSPEYVPESWSHLWNLLAEREASA